MKNILLLASALFVCLQAYSQKPIDLEAIKVATQDTAYYNGIARKFFNQMVSEQELIDLYYGHAFQTNYAPYDVVIWEPDIRNMQKEGKYKDALAFCLRLFEERPGYLPAIYNTAMTVGQMDLSDELKSWGYMHTGALLRTILSSGDGKSKETAFIVTSIKDEYLLMDILLGVKPTEKLELTEENGKYYDIMNVVPSDKYDSDKVYFDITLPFSQIGKSNISYQ